MQIKRCGAGEDLQGSVETINQVSVTGGSPQTYLDHDHRERENIRLFARYTPPVQDFGCSPPRSPTWCYTGCLDGALILREAEICYTRAAVSAHHDVRLRALIY